MPIMSNLSNFVVTSPVYDVMRTWDNQNGILSAIKIVDIVCGLMQSSTTAIRSLSGRDKAAGPVITSLEMLCIINYIDHIFA